MFDELMRKLLMRGGFKELVQKTKKVYKGTVKSTSKPTGGSLLDLLDALENEDDLSSDFLISSNDPRINLFREVEAELACLRQLSESFYTLRDTGIDPVHKVKLAVAKQSLEMQDLQPRYPEVIRKRPFRRNGQL